MIGFALLVTWLAPLNFGTASIDPDKVAAFIHAHPHALIIWNTLIYIVNAAALVVVCIAIHGQLHPSAPGLSTIALAYGLIWSALVLGAGMIANVAVERVNQNFPADPAAAAEL